MDRIKDLKICEKSKIYIKMMCEYKKTQKFDNTTKEKMMLNCMENILETEGILDQKSGLMAAVKHLNSIKDEGYISLEHHILNTHKACMKSICKTAGKWSESVRYTSFRQQIYFYPRYIHSDLCQTAMQTLCDYYNCNHLKISQSQEDEAEKMALVFKNIALFLASCLTLHPFSDGSGRTFKLLTAHLLSKELGYYPTLLLHQDQTMFIECLILARKNLKHLKTITSKQEANMLIYELSYLNIEALCDVLVSSAFLTVNNFIHGHCKSQ
jgi:hypothetical protein